MDIEKYIYSECQNPNKVKIYNGVNNCYEVKDVPCGKCYHCKITRINEWVTRMVIQSNMSNYVYYGTLTYGSKKHTQYHKETLAIMSDHNKNKSLTYTPIILRKDHLQKFFKRLRKNTGVKFQYAACGEYGGTYSRPHYHYIMWSNEPISQIDVYKAWTAPLLDDPKKRVILGKIEHRDIKHNAYPAPNDPDNTAVYKYVCKYIQKTDFNFDKLTNINRLTGLIPQLIRKIADLMTILKEKKSRALTTIKKFLVLSTCVVKNLLLVTSTWKSILTNFKLETLDYLAYRESIYSHYILCEKPKKKSVLLRLKANQMMVRLHIHVFQKWQPLLRTYNLLNKLLSLLTTLCNYFGVTINYTTMKLPKDCKTCKNSETTTTLSQTESSNMSSKENI